MSNHSNQLENQQEQTGNQPVNTQQAGYQPGNSNYSQSLEKFGFGGAFKAFWKNYGKFRGRSVTAEFGWIFLFVILVSGAFFADIVLFGGISLSDLYQNIIVNGGKGEQGIANQGAVFGVSILIFALFYLVILIPFITLTIRRFHDVGLNAFAWLLVMIVTAVPYPSSILTDIISVVFALLLLLISFLPSNSLKFKLGHNALGNFFNWKGSDPIQ
jgi:uncharacterized membrane protein YhaH (DUF805 family)